MRALTAIPGGEDHGRQSARSRRGMLRGLGARVFLLVALVSMPALAYILYSASAQRRAARERVEQSALVLARLSAREHARQIAGARDLLATLARPGATWWRDATGSQAFLVAVHQGFRHFANMGVLSPEGTLLHSVVAPRHPVEMGSLPVIHRALASRDVEVGDYQIGLIVGTPVLVLATVLRDEDDAVRGVLFVALDLHWFGQLAEQAALPEGSSFTIVDREGRILARSLEGATSIGTTVPGWADSGIPARREGVVNAVDVDGVRRLTAFSPLEGVKDVFVLVGVPERRALAESTQALVQSLFVLAFIATLVAAGGFTGAEVVVLRRVRALCRATRALAAGDLSVRASEVGGGELAELSVAFNAMASALETRQAEAAAAARERIAREEQLRVLSRSLQTAREQESARIARDLHDQLGQALTGIKLELARFERRLGRAADGASRDELTGTVADLAVHIDETIDIVRSISSELRPGVLDQLGLPAAIEWQAREFESRTGVRCALAIDSVAEGLDPDARTAVFRIVQEALTNVARHAQATAVDIELRGDRDGIELRVRDDGRGIGESATADPRSVGLAGMRERAELLGGRLSVSRRVGGGTEAYVRIPRARSGTEGP